MFLIFVQSILSSGISQTNDDISTATDNADLALEQNAANTIAISSLETTTQNMTATPSNTSFAGNLDITTSLTVNGLNVNNEITSLENTVSTGQYTIDSLTVNNLTAEAISTEELYTTILIPEQGILLTPCGYYFDSMNGTAATNKDFRVEYIAAIQCTIGRMTQWNDVHGYLINPGFSLRAFRDANFVNLAGEFVNTWASPAVFMTNETTFSAGKVNSVIVYYGGKLFNPLAYGQNPTIGNGIPSQYQTGPTVSTVPPEGTPFYA